MLDHTHIRLSRRDIRSCLNLIMPRYVIPLLLKYYDARTFGQQYSGWSLENT